MRRRDFLSATGAMATGLFAGGTAASATGHNLGRGRVIQVTAPGLVVDATTIRAVSAAGLLDRALIAAAGVADPVAALARFVSADDTVGLKINCLGCPTMVVQPALTARLVKLLGAVGVSPDRIVVYDQHRSRMRRAGYRAANEPGRPRVLHHKASGWGYQAQEQTLGGEQRFRWAKILSHCSAVINLCVPKDHYLTGTTGALKNMACGNIDRPDLFHGQLQQVIPRIYARPEIRSRSRLVVCDASRVLWDGGPQDSERGRSAYDSLLISTDPVAMDWAILELVNEHRVKNRLRPIEELTTPRVRAPSYIAEAARLGLGATLRELEWYRVGSTGAALRHTPAHIGHIPPVARSGGGAGGGQ